MDIQIHLCYSLELLLFSIQIWVTLDFDFNNPFCSETSTPRKSHTEKMHTIHEGILTAYPLVTVTGSINQHTTNANRSKKDS